MAAHVHHRTKRGFGRLALIIAVAGGAASIAGAGVYAGLQATATGTSAVSSATLSLTMAAGTGSTGFPQTITNMAPGDVVNTYVDLTNGSSLAAQDLTLTVTGTGSTLLTTSTTKGLNVTIKSCATAWTFATGVCSGGSTTLGTAADPVATLTGTPNTLVSGAVATSALYHLQVVLTLPDQAETTTNGTPPGSTIQGLSTTLTYSFNELQRAATTTAT
ncbi:MAG: hypothetical protein ACYDH6_08940 [Acidimicrobiales bacterium]